jgi:hypothetical protein
MADSPFTAATGASAAGFGLSLFGGLSAMGAASAASQASIDQLKLEQQVQDVRMQAMTMQNQRSQMERVRSAQVQRSMAESAAVNQGAQFSSGLQGAYGNISGKAGQGELGTSMAQQYGMQIYGLEQQVTGAKIQQAHEQSLQATDQGIASIGGALSSIAKLPFMGV